MAFNAQRFQSIQREWFELAKAKNQDYGGENITKTGFGGVLVRLVDKAYRQYNLINSTSAKPNFESIHDTLRDIANYAVIAAMVDEGSWDVRLPIKVVYLAGPIDAVSRPDAMGWRDQVAGLLSREDITSYNPCAAFVNGHLDTAEAIDRVNRVAIQSCDAVIARFTDKAPSVGTPREIEFARSLNKPVVVWADNEKFKRHLAAFDVEVTYSAEGAVRKLLGKTNVIREDWDSSMPLDEAIIDGDGG